ncbi:MAG TPA: peptidase domain-containing ABC transporter [Mycobacteriales bacterium]|nr:peptidase domain-containing ABC transporter [Mycobacteriales bacterium]
MRRRPPLRLVRQLELGDCGAACLAMLLRQHRRPVALSDLRDLTGTGRDGVTAAGLVSAAQRFGLTGTGVRCPVDRLAELAPGTVLHWNGNHFVVLAGRHRRGLVVLDPALGRRVVSDEEVRRSYSGVALRFTVDENASADVAVPDTAPSRDPRRRGRSRLATYRPLVRGTGRTAALALGCAVVVQAFVLANPIVLRYVVDRLTGDVAGVGAGTLALGVVALAVGYLLAVVGRLAFLVALQRVVDFRLTLGVLEHLVAQPYAFIARRSVGDLTLRLRSTVIVRQVLTAGALSAILDGALVVGYLVLIAALDVWFGLLTIGAVAGQVLVVAAAWPRLRRTSAEVLEAQTRSQGELLEIIGGLQLLKASGTAMEVVTGWSGRLRTEVHAQAGRSRLAGVVDAVLLTVRFGAPPLLLVLGLSRVASGALDLPDMLALAALSAAVTVPTGGLLSTVSSMSTVGSYLDRIDDLLEAEPERRGGRPLGDRLAGRVDLADVSYAYSPLSRPAVRGVTLRIDAGEHVAIVGRSGSGKTTLAMLVATLYDPTTGTVGIDNFDAREYDPVELRRRVGVVTQDTVLFAMTIRDNLALGRPDASDADIEAAARIAAVHDEITALPSGYRTMLGNGGSGLSGGQRQRLALARALVGRPGLLVLDEATSALDAPSEESVHRGLAALRSTRVVVAHRPSTIRRADRIVVLRDGELVAEGTHARLLRSSAEYRELVGTGRAGSGRLS